MDIRGEWPADELKDFKNDMKLLPNFITEEEEQKLFEEVEPYMKRLRYEYDHWDDVNILKKVKILVKFYKFVYFPGYTWFS